MAKVHSGADVKSRFKPLSEADIEAYSDDASFRKGCGTQQRSTLQEALETLHDFKEVVTFKLTGGWVRDEKKLSAKR